MKISSILSLAVLAYASSASACANLYAQCGGKTYTGETCCSSGSCSYVNDWYSQCVPGSTGSSGGGQSPASSPKTSPRTSQRASPSPSPNSNGGGNTGSGATPVSGGASGNGKTTRYWDCCKPSCAWTSNVSGVSGAVKTCSNNGSKLTDQNVKNVCSGGGTSGPGDGFAYMCTDNQPFAVNDNLAYGFAAASISGVAQSRMCCSCYELTFTSGPVQGKKMIVQTTNTGGDLGENHFDIQMPGGGLGIFDGCSKQFGVDASTWGARYGGISSASGCSVLPSSLQAGCQWHFGWFQGADNPSVSFREVVCPAAITNISGCKRN